MEKENTRWRSYGIDLKREELEQSESDWVFRSWTLSCLAKIPLALREKYLPKGEVQRGREDFMDCASRGPINILEAKFTWLLENKKFPFGHEVWLRENGYVIDEKVTFSDVFIAINSKTTRQGNSFKAPLEAIRKHGLIPKSMLPANSNMTWEEYHDQSKITHRMQVMGWKFMERFKINYEKVYEDSFKDILVDDYITVAGYAWPPTEGGEHVRVDYAPNHLFVLWKPLYYAFDNYLDAIGNDFIKKLAPDYNFYKSGYRLSVNVKPVVQTSIWAIHPYMRAKKLLGCLFT